MQSIPAGFQNSMSILEKSTSKNKRSGHEQRPKKEKIPSFKDCMKKEGRQSGVCPKIGGLLLQEKWWYR
jgi:hypothetical protein